VSDADFPGGLTAETEEVLRRARAGARMPQVRKRRLKGAVLARIAVASTATLAAGQGAATAMGAGFVAKAVVGIALVGSLGAGISLALRPARHATPHAAPAPRPAAPARLIEAPAAEPPAAEPPAALVERAPIVHAHRPAARPVARDDARTLAAETALLRDADRALRAGDTATALARLDEHATRFPNGALAPERSAERLIVLCELGVADPRAVSRFLDARSGSPLAARVRSACAPKP
jgi:TolA-binding protein